MINFLFTILLSFSNAKEFKPDNYCYLVNTITSQTVAETIQCLKTKKKLLVISNGGELESGEVLIEFVNRKKITVLCVQCYSMAAYLWLSADKREFGEGGQLMVHYAYSVVGAMTKLTIFDMREHANYLQTKTESYFNKLTLFQKKFFIDMMLLQGDYFFGQDVLDMLQIKYTFIAKPKEKTDAN